MQQELSSIESTLGSFLTTTNQTSREGTEIIHDIREVLRFIKKDQSLGNADGAASENNMKPTLPYETPSLQVIACFMRSDYLPFPSKII